MVASKLAFQFVRAAVPQTAQQRSTTRVESSAGEHLTFSMQSLRGINICIDVPYDRALLSASRKPIEPTVDSRLRNNIAEILFALRINDTMEESEPTNLQRN